MWSSEWSVGLDIQSNSVRAVALERRRRGWWLTKLWHHPVPDGTFRDEFLLDPRGLGVMLNNLRKTLPLKIRVQIALPPALVMQHELSVPSEIAPRNYGLYVSMSLNKLFPAGVSPVSDYRIHPSKTDCLIVTMTQSATMQSWLTALEIAELPLEAVDLTPCILRYIVRHHGLPAEALLIHVGRKDSLVVAPLSKSLNFATLQTGKMLLYEARSWCADNCGMVAHTILLSGEAEWVTPEFQDWDGVQMWSPLTGLNHTNAQPSVLPPHFALACGLALRARDG